MALISFTPEQQGFARSIGNLACDGWVTVQVFGPSGGLWVGHDKQGLESVSSGLAPETRGGFYVRAGGIVSIPFSAGDVWILNGAGPGDQDTQWANVELSTT